MNFWVVRWNFCDFYVVLSSNNAFDLYIIKLSIGLCQLLSVSLQITDSKARKRTIRHCFRPIVSNMTWTWTRTPLINWPPYATGWGLLPQVWILRDLHSEFIPLARKYRQAESISKKQYNKDLLTHMGRECWRHIFWLTILSFTIIFFRNSWEVMWKRG